MDQTILFFHRISILTRRDVSVMLDSTFAVTMGDMGGVLDGGDEGGKGRGGWWW